MPGCPIRTSADQFVCADPRSFSQLTPSFFASESLGIRHTPLTISFLIVKLVQYFSLTLLLKYFCKLKRSIALGFLFVMFLSLMSMIFVLPGRLMNGYCFWLYP